MRLKSIYLPFLFFLLLSCSKSDMSTIEDPILIKGNILLGKILSLKTEELKKLAYGTLIPSERYSLWKAKLTVAAEKEGLTSAQVQKIKEINNLITPQVFQEGDAKQAFHNGWMPIWFETASKLFSSKEIYDMVLSINVVDIPLPKIANGTTINNEGPPATPPHACICALNSNTTCGHWNTSSWPYVWTYEICSKTAEGCLTNPNTACGFLWDNECDGDKCPWITQQPQ